MGIFQDINQLNVLIIGASGGIGLGFVKTLQQYPQVNQIYATYRRSESAVNLLSIPNIKCLKVDITIEQEISQVIQQISEKTNQLHLVINCVGILHENELQPEKSLAQINSENLLYYFQVNSIASLLLAKHLLPLLKHDENSIFASISAKVGSIGDNKLGGWYGYRASKAALNMFMRNIAIEYSRKSPKTAVVSLHPGTTDTQISRPFQKNVPPEKLFSVERTVTQLLTVISNLNITDSGEFFSYDGTKLPW
jgi:NAD(P)-dependent dehydrogenase (short-subunit alcohol dehydrogenase family)